MATTITLDDDLFAQVQQHAGENPEAWIAKACRSQMLTESLRAHAEWERAHPEEAARERTEEASRSLEAEAEHEIQHQAEEAARRRGGEEAEPTAEEVAAAEARVCALFDRTDRRLRERGHGDRFALHGLDGVLPDWPQYLVVVEVPAPVGYDGDDAMLMFLVKSPEVPRVGESLEFDGRGNGLDLVVTAVNHTFSMAHDSPHPHHKVVVDAHLPPSPIEVRTAQELFLDEAKMAKWIEQLPLVSPYKFTRSGPCAECGE